MTTKPNPFLAGMRATGRRPEMTKEDRKEYEAGYRAILDIADAMYSMENYMQQTGDAARAQATRLMTEIDAAWSRIKAAIASEVTPAHCECGDDPHTTYNGTVKAYTCDDCGKPVKS